MKHILNTFIVLAFFAALIVVVSDIELPLSGILAVKSSGLAFLWACVKALVKLNPEIKDEEI